MVSPRKKLPGEPERVNKLKARALAPEPLGFVGNKPQVELNVVAYDNPCTQVLEQGGKLGGQGTASRSFALPLESHAPVIHDSHLGYARPAIRTKAGRLDVEEDERGYL